MQSWKRRPAKMQKNATLETEAGRNAKKNAKSLRALPKPQKSGKFAVSWSICIFFAFCLHFFCISAGLCFQGCIFFAFWPAVSSRIASFSHFGRSQELSVPFFLHFAGPEASQPTKMEKKCNAKFRQGSKHKKNANSKCKKNATYKKMQTANAKQCKIHAKQNSKC